MSTITDRLSGISTSLAVKAPCQAVSSANLTLSGEQTVNGIAVTDGDRVLVKDQTDATENGIWVVRTTAWERAADFDGNRDVRQGTLVIVFNSVAQGVIYQVTAANPIVIGTSVITFELDDDPNITYPQVQAEIEAGVTPSDTKYEEGHLYRYGDSSVLGNGTNDDTSAWTAMLSFSGHKYVPKPTSKYKIDSIDLANQSNMFVYIESGTIVEANTGITDGNSLFEFPNSSNITFWGYFSTFQMLKAEYTTGEQRHVFFVADCSDIAFYGITAADSGGDGWNVGLRSNFAQRVTVKDCISDNNKRNGVSITAGRDIWFINHLSKDTNGISPECGYDIEPNEDDVTSGQTEGPLENVHLTNCRAENNTSVGFQYAGGNYAIVGPFSVHLSGCVSRGDAINFSVVSSPDGEGLVELVGCKGYDAKQSGLNIKGSNIPVVWTGGAIFNPNQNAGSTNRNGSAVVINSVNGTDGEDIGNVSIRGLKVRDPDGNMLKTVVLQLVGEASSTISDVDIEIDAKGIADNKRTFESGSNALHPMEIRYTDKPIHATTSTIGSTSSPQFANQKITNEGASGAITINVDTSDSQYIGNRYEFEVKVAQNLIVATDAGNELLPDNVTSLTSSTIGSKLTIEWDGGNWQVTQKIGTWA